VELSIDSTLVFAAGRKGSKAKNERESPRRESTPRTKVGCRRHKRRRDPQKSQNEHIESTVSNLAWPIKTLNIETVISSPQSRNGLIAGTKKERISITAADRQTSNDCTAARVPTWFGSRRSWLPSDQGSQGRWLEKKIRFVVATVLPRHPGRTRECQVTFCTLSRRPPRQA
jgi:hypothetical protein